MRALASSALGLPLLALPALSGCSERDSDLIVAAKAPSTEPDPATPVELPQAVRDAIDERPLGGASLASGTTGGGTYSSARAGGALFRVSSLEQLKARVSGDAPAIVVVEAGRYVGAGIERTARACHQTCDADDPNTEQTTPEARCTNGEELFDVTLDSDELRVGSNKTIIGLDGGAELVNVSVSLDGSANVILRNLSIEDVDREVAAGNDGISLGAAHHVWLDHLTLREIARTALLIVSTWDQDQDQAIVDESGYVTITNVDFDGTLTSACSQRSETVLTTNRNPAITIAHCWFHGARIRVPNLFGPGTWAHLYNNLWTDIDGRGLAVSCGAAGIAQGNVFQSSHNGLYNSDSGLPDWQFCATGFFGTLYAPEEDAGAEANLLDAASSQNLGGQPTSGEGLTPPRLLAEQDYELTVPIGASTQSYRVTLADDPSTVADTVPMTAGVGRLF